ncbi:DNA-binding protein [Sulfurimonas sp.]|uniref:DNA-binding protein n=1 Tax=Sulfurimonas sp. TaxID=2022749 RepID=UPI0035663A0A
MSKMSISDAALRLGVSKEAIHNRIRRGSLESVMEDGVKYVLLKEDSSSPANKQAPKRANTKVAHEPDSRYYKLLEEQNEKLQQKVDKLEGETKTLREQKEQMLVQERIRIEKIYKDKDEQLKNILNAISSKFLLNAPTEELIVESQELVEAEIESAEPSSLKQSSDLISLKKYLKDGNYTEKKSQKIKDRFKKAAKKDSRIVTVGKKYYINTNKFDYSDLLH